MIKYSKSYLECYEGLPEKLAQQYSKLSFENHCYLRIALDNVFNTKWDTVISRPAYKHLSEQQRKNVVKLLKSYQEDKSLLLRHNALSLQYRKK